MAINSRKRNIIIGAVAVPLLLVIIFVFYVQSVDKVEVGSCLSSSSADTKDLKVVDCDSNNAVSKVTAKFDDVVENDVEKKVNECPHDKGSLFINYLRQDGEGDKVTIICYKPVK